VGKEPTEVVVMPERREDLPATIRRSSAKAQRTYLKTLENAHRQYRSEERAHRTAMAALKDSFEKVGDHWEPKRRRGPSDPQAAQTGRAARERPKKTYGGVDLFGHTKDELYERARKLGIAGRSKMSKEQLAGAIARKS
jgi:cation transport regulator ChaB